MHRRTHPARLDGMTPVEVAAGLRHLPGLLFFDTAGNLPSSAARPVSVIAARPARILRGSIHDAADRAMLRAALADAPPSSGDHGFPLGGLCGWVDYEGAFVFGDYPGDAGLQPQRPHAGTKSARSPIACATAPAEAVEIGPFAATHRAA